jgi:alkanesulfonate monooxygenase SsuD/methylene tetrahydromethanopterin reductase-like flavin-dependent oxidoreductase (luciferase family)
MPSSPLPAVSLAAVPGRRKAIVELAGEIESRGFSGIYCPSMGDGLGLCEALALAALVQELSGGRFLFGIGVSHQPVHKRLGVRAGKPLADVRAFVDEIGQVPRVGELPPLVLAGLRKRMVALAGEIASGVVFANAARSHMGNSLAAIPRERLADPAFFVGNMVPTCISEDRAAAAAVNRRTLTGYAMLPNYRNYWKEAGYVEEMEAVEKALEAREVERVPELLSDRWLADTTLFGSAREVREGAEAWVEAGVKTPILVPSSAAGNQLVAFKELFDAYS